MHLTRMKIGAKLALAIGVVMLLMLALGGFALRQMALINAHTEALAGDWLPSIRTLAQMQNVVNDMRRAELQLVLAKSPQDRAGETRRLVDGRKRLGEARAAYAPLVSSAEESQLFDEAKKALAVYLAANDRLLALAQQPEASADEVQAFLIGDSRKAFRVMTGLLDKLDKLNYEGSLQAKAIAEQAYATARTTVIALLACAALIATAFTVWIGRMIAQPIIRAAELTRQVASGDLTQRIEARGSDEPAQLMRALAHMQQQFVQTVSKVRDNAESVSMASAEIATGNFDLRQRTEQQASSLQQSASAMEELSSTVRLNSDNARHADELARNASEVATEGGRVVAEVVGTMKRIDESSRKISDIIAVIDGIAFQTNILALNAAVEAARAGEQGRGFAVVATEVRTLAQRSATAAREIKQLIADSVERVGAGTQQVDQARLTMTQVVSAIDDVCKVVAQISTATDEQATGIAEVGKAVAQMDQVTQQNAALVEESAAAAGSLKSQASRLVEAVAAFRISPLRA